LQLPVSDTWLLCLVEKVGSMIVAAAAAAAAAANSLYFIDRNEQNYVTV